MTMMMMLKIQISHNNKTIKKRRHQLILMTMEILMVVMMIMTMICNKNAITMITTAKKII